MGYITTYTEKKIDPLMPDAAMFDVRDYAHALSLTCRGNGHVKRFLSVGQHCVWCAKEAAARGYSQRVVLACLLHDASEAYMSDVPRPLKEILPEYVQTEEKLIDLIYTKFLGSPLTQEEQEYVKKVDDDLLYFDLKELLGFTDLGEQPEIKIKLDYTVRPFEEVEQEYLGIYEAWKLV